MIVPDKRGIPYDIGDRIAEIRGVVVGIDVGAKQSHPSRHTVPLIRRLLRPYGEHRSTWICNGISAPTADIDRR
jgi:hypothetical protein